MEPKAERMKTEISSLGRTSRGIWGDERGVSLLEIIIVLIILSLLVGLSTPKLYNSVRNFQCKRAARSLASLLRYAHQRAILTKRTQIVHIDLDGQVTKLIPSSYSDPGGVGEESPPPKTLVTLRFPSTVRHRLIVPERATVIDSGKRDIIFYPTGSSTGETIELINVIGTVYRIILDPVTGLPTISRGAS
jgi:prepilin-type N-terminal cleavage/methylation domain-containing protein